MSEQPNAYAAVIADLKRKRQKIDQAIKALEELSGEAGPVGSVEPDTVSTSAPAEGAFLGMTIPDATKRLLETRKKVLGNAEIVRELEAGGVVFTSENKINVVGSVLNRRAKQAGDIVSVSRGKWGLKQWYPNKRFDRKGNDDEQNKTESDETSRDVVTSESNDSSEHEPPFGPPQIVPLRSSD